MIKVNGKDIIDVESLNEGTTIEFEDGRQLRLYSKEELIELINVLDTIKVINNLS